MEPLPALLKKNRRVVIAFDDITVPFPPMLSDVRRIILNEISNLIKKSGIRREDVTFLCATGLKRRCFPREIRHILGKKVWREWIDRVKIHMDKDARWIGDTSEGERVEINQLLLQADLVIYISITFLPINGGWKSVVTGTGSFQTILSLINPVILGESPPVDPQSQFQLTARRIGEIISRKVNIFKIEVVLSNLFLPPIEEVQNLMAKVPLTTEVLRRLPEMIKKNTLNSLRGWYPLYKVYAGNPRETHDRALRDVYKQLTLPVREKYDAIIFGLPNLSPYSLQSVANPVIIHSMVNGYLYMMFEKALKKKGIIIFWNPLEEKFDLEKHLSYAYLYNNHLPLDCNKRHLRIEEELWKDRRFHHIYNNGFGFHGVHAMVSWYLGCRGKNKTAKQISIGGTPYVADKLGMLTANNVMEAIEEASRYRSIDRIGFFAFPPIFLIG